MSSRFESDLEHTLQWTTDSEAIVGIDRVDMPFRADLRTETSRCELDVIITARIRVIVWPTSGSSMQLMESKPLIKIKDLFSRGRSALYSDA